MFCPKCGNELSGDELFCMSCGTKITQNKQQDADSAGKENSISAQMNTRKDSVDEMNRVIGYFQKKAQVYDRYDYLEERIPRLSRFSMPALLVLGILLSVGGIVLWFGVAVFFVYLYFKASLTGLIEGGSLDAMLEDLWYTDSRTAVIMFTVFCLFFVVLGIVFIIITARTNIKRKKVLKSMIDEFASVSRELSEYYIAFGPCIVGAEFTNPYILNEIRRTIQIGRADTPKEAINVMLDDVHKTQMQLNAELQLKSLKSIKTNTAIAAGADIATSVFCGGNFFRNLVG